MTGTPFTGYRTTVLAEWLDYNGHMNDASYAVVCTQANEVLLDRLGLSASYQHRTGCAMYTVEAHLRYLDEVGPDDHLYAESFLVSADTKRLRMHTTVFRSDDVVALTGEYLFLHVDQRAGKVCVLPEERQLVVDAMAGEHAQVPRPEHLGGGVG